MSAVSERQAAFDAIRALQMPPEWHPFQQHLKFTGMRMRWEGRQPTGDMFFSALGSHPGRIEVRCRGMRVTTSIKHLNRAVRMCLEWLDNTRF